MIHELRTIQPYFDDIASCKKTFEVRRDDIQFEVGDFLALNEYDSTTGYTGRCALIRITYIMSEKEFCKDGYVILGIDGAGIITHRWINRPPQELGQGIAIPVYDRK